MEQKGQAVMDESSSRWVGLGREHQPPGAEQTAWAGHLGKVLDVDVPVLIEMKGGKGHLRDSGRGHADQTRPPQKSKVVKR